MVTWIGVAATLTQALVDGMVMVAKMGWPVSLVPWSVFVWAGMVTSVVTGDVRLVWVTVSQCRGDT